jgi:hypothetical protein
LADRPGDYERLGLLELAADASGDLRSQARIGDHQIPDVVLVHPAVVGHPAAAEGWPAGESAGLLAKPALKLLAGLGAGFAIGQGLRHDAKVAVIDRLAPDGNGARGAN